METIVLQPPVAALTAGFTQVQALAASGPAPVRGATRFSGMQTRQGFCIGNLRLMVRYEDGSELTEMPQTYPLPNTPAWFRGIANLHGMLTPVFDLAAYIGVQSDGNARPMLLVLAHGADAAGVVIDGLPRRLRWTEQDIADAGAAPPRIAPHVSAAALIGGELWFDLERAALLDALEQAMQQQH